MHTERLMALIAEECDDADDNTTIGDVMDKARERYYLRELQGLLFFTLKPLKPHESTIRNTGKV